MQVKDIKPLIPEVKIIGSLEEDIKGIQYDSRLLRPGDTFVAMSGFKIDGHQFVNEAINKGAKIIVMEKDMPLPEKITKVIVPNTRLALAILSNSFYSHPSDKLKLIGVTGTNGKTSTSYLIHDFLNSNNIKTGILGTVEKKIGNKVYENMNTTPESLVLQKILADMKKEKAEAVVMEVSSHALELHRVDGTNFDLAIFTNLTHDHLDFHKDMENYFKSKIKLFSKLKKSGWAVINSDDPYGFRLASNLPIQANSFTYGLGDKAQIKARNFKVDEGISFDLSTPFGNKRLFTPYLYGIYNLYNLLAAVSSMLALGLSLNEVERAIGQIQRIPGRFEQVNMGQDFKVIIDYAHTPDGVKKVLQLARSMQGEGGRIITVLGAAGERDPFKRPIMGRIAAQLSDLFIITEQDSRSEDVNKIISEIYSGAKGWGEIEVIDDRLEAIRFALNIAEKDDMILILGKGHEKTLFLNRESDYQGDYDVVKNYLSSSPFITS